MLRLSAASREIARKPLTGSGLARNRTMVRDARLQVGDLLADRYAGDPQIPSRAEVALDEHAHRVPALFRG